MAEKDIFTVKSLIIPSPYLLTQIMHILLDCGKQDFIATIALLYIYIYISCIQLSQFYKSGTDRHSTLSCVHDIKATSVAILNKASMLQMQATGISRQMKSTIALLSRSKFTGITTNSPDTFPRSF